MNRPVPSQRASRVKLLLVMAVFAAPILAAAVLTAVGWQPAGKAHGLPVEPQRNFVAEPVRVALADGTDYPWRDPVQPRMTLVALAGPDCAERCFAALTAMAKARVMLNNNQSRLRLLYVGEPPADAVRLAAMKGFWVLGRDVDGKLAGFRPAAADGVSALLVESDGTALSFYPGGLERTDLLQDLLKVIR